MLPSHRHRPRGTSRCQHFDSWSRNHQIYRPERIPIGSPIVLVGEYLRPGFLSWPNEDTLKRGSAPDQMTSIVKDFRKTCGIPRDHLANMFEMTGCINKLDAEFLTHVGRPRVAGSATLTAPLRRITADPWNPEGEKLGTHAPTRVARRTTLTS